MNLSLWHIHCVLLFPLIFNGVYPFYGFRLSCSPTSTFGLPWTQDEQGRLREYDTRERQ